jgi:hypothetical protein
MDIDSQFTFALISLSIALYAEITYLIAVLKKEVRPHIFTWIIWTVLSWIAVAAQFSDNAGIGIITMVFIALFCPIIVILSLKYGTKDITKFDKIILAMSLISIVPWLITKEPLLSVVMICVIEIMAMIPTARKSWNDPWGENLKSYFAGTINFILSVFALTNFSFVTAAYPLAIVLVHSSLITLCLYRRRTIARPIYAFNSSQNSDGHIPTTLNPQSTK